MSKNVKLSISEQLEFMTDHPNKSLEWYLTKLNISEATFYRRKRSIKNQSSQSKQSKKSTIDKFSEEVIDTDVEDEKHNCPFCENETDRDVLDIDLSEEGYEKALKLCIHGVLEIRLVTELRNWLDKKDVIVKKRKQSLIPKGEEVEFI